MRQVAELHKADKDAFLGQRQHVNSEELVCRAACPLENCVRQKILAKGCMGLTVPQEENKLSDTLSNIPLDV